MDHHSLSGSFLFEGFRFDPSRGGLFRVGQAGGDEPVAVGAHALDLLGLLLHRSGQLVSKDDMMDAVWPGAAVEEGNLTVQMSSLRRILDQKRAQGTCIQTVAKRGYRFIAPVTRVAEAASRSSASSGPVINPGLKSTGRADGQSIPDRAADRATNGAPVLLPPFHRPAIAVLPFTSASGSLNQELLSDGIAEDICTALSRYSSLSVTARQSSFAYRGRAINATQIARELRVRYVVEGSVRSAGKRIRTTCWLVDAESGNQIWSDRYDRDFADFFAGYDAITQTVSVAVASGIAYAEQQRAMRTPAGSLTAWGAYQRGLWYRARMSPEDNVLAEQFFQKAIDLDPMFAGGYRALALAQLDGATQFHVRGFEQARTAAEVLAVQAIALDRTDAEAHSAYAATLLLGHGDHEGARIEAERALALTPHLASAHGVLGAVFTYAGQPRKGLASFATFIGLDPSHPMMGVRLQQVTAALYFSGDHDAAIKAGKRAIRSYPDNPQVYRWLAAALVRLGRIPEAKETVAKAISVAPGSFDMYVRQRVPWMRPRDHESLVDDLAKVGWQHDQGKESR